MSTFFDCSKSSLRKRMAKLLGYLHQLVEMNSKIEDVRQCIYELNKIQRYGRSYETLVKPGEWSEAIPNNWLTRPHVIQMNNKKDELKGLQKEAKDILIRIGGICRINIDSYKERTDFFIKFWKKFRFEQKVQEIAIETKKKVTLDQSKKDASFLIDMIALFLINISDFGPEFFNVIKKCRVNGCMFLVGLIVSSVDLYRMRWGEGLGNPYNLSVLYDDAMISSIILVLYNDYGSNDCVLWSDCTSRYLDNCFKRHNNEWEVFIRNCYERVNPLLVKVGFKI